MTASGHRELRSLEPIFSPQVVRRLVACCVHAHDGGGCGAEHARRRGPWHGANRDKSRRRVNREGANRLEAHRQRGRHRQQQQWHHEEVSPEMAGDGFRPRRLAEIPNYVFEYMYHALMCLGFNSLILGLPRRIPRLLVHDVSVDVSSEPASGRSSSRSTRTLRKARPTITYAL